ncbi:MAG: N-acetylmuramoyl-L-alanine amidase, partial [Flavobacteriaceae bacterium]|nr:N-acetylmuramoyl-L-alanine amidase [Flavobacteriaceae bacterium]
HTDNPDLEIDYYGRNPKANGSADTDTIKNYWLDVEGKWFEVKGCECCYLKLDKDGFFISKKITKNRISKLEKYNWKKKVQYIILHRTVTPNTKSTLNSFKKGIGTHFLVGKDGKTYQTATLNKTTSHIKNGYNSSTVGIEVVGMPYDKDGVLTKGYPSGNPVDHWDSVSTEQAKSVACIVKALLNHYNLDVSAIRNHENLQAKAKDEGKTVYDAIINLIK